MFKAAGYLLWLAILFPALSVPAFISLTMTLCYGIGAGMLTAIGIGAGHGLWAALDANFLKAGSRGLCGSDSRWGGDTAAPGKRSAPSTV